MNERMNQLLTRDRKLRNFYLNPSKNIKFLNASLSLLQYLKITMYFSTDFPSPPLGGSLTVTGCLDSSV